MLDEAAWKRRRKDAVRHLVFVVGDMNPTMAPDHCGTIVVTSRDVSVDQQFPENVRHIDPSFIGSPPSEYRPF